MKPIRRNPYDSIAAIWGAFYVMMLTVVHTAWFVAWKYQHSRPQLGSSIDPFEGWDRLVGLMGVGHLALFYGSPAAGCVALTGFIVGRLRGRSTLWFATILLGSVLAYVADPFGAIAWWFD